ncbi:hypothetical protein GWI33_002464 [Rhynchophorus ferrugineus]|uniref:Uncharacterized protein n=1 Tax=Rhynchophorus ferrugineus TaxID=354439 RepID=A0A834MK98_RHYFE|nr:hypothetical protein GWI33_002464 [Rhynchophorus ferrugineus]
MVDKIWIVAENEPTVILLAISVNLGSRNNTSLDKFFQDCKDRSGVNDDDYELIKKKKVPSSPEGICMVDCLFTKLHIIEHGRFNKRGFVVIFSAAVRGNIQKLKKLNDLGNMCEKEITIIESEGCNVTKQFLNCLGRHKDMLQVIQKS